MADVVQNKINTLLDKFEQKRGKIDLSLGRITAFLEKIGNPQLNIPPVIHFAGTNGKGSTLAFLKAMIEASGKTCHAYTSPHLVRFNERITIAGREIDNDSLLKTLERVDSEYENHKHEIELTFFELTTIVAFIAFSQSKADYTLLETGLGGRYDATNLIARPLCTVITPVSYDHMDFLGNYLSSIAREKAGIMKKHVPCISSPQMEEVAKILEECAREVAAELEFAPLIANLPELSLKGEHQKINASTAARTASEIGIGQEAIEKGFTTAKWPARMQKLIKGKLPELLPAGFDLWLDGAHNLAGAEALAVEISKSTKPVYLVVGMLNTKDASSYFNALKNQAKAVYTIPIPDDLKTFTAVDLAKIAATAGFPAIAAANEEEAIKEIVSSQTAPASIFITGSLYLAGYILKDNS